VGNNSNYSGVLILIAPWDVAAQHTPGASL
jgi:hypothetical protein